jgi:hypothetical protein
MTQAALTPKEQTRYDYRVGLFGRRGWTADRARLFAGQLRTRDAERDDRRACIECAHLQRQGTCFQAQQCRFTNARRDMTPVQDQLQRCEFFTFQKP